MNRSNLRLGLTNKLFSNYFHRLLVLLVVSLTTVTAPLASDLVFDSDTSTIRNSTISVDDNSVLSAYTKPNQSRIWYNSHQNRWDALVPRFDSTQTFSQSDHYIMKDVPGFQTFTNVALEDRDFARPDVFWDDNNRKLYVLSSHPAASEFWRLGYDNANDNYRFEVGVQRAGGIVPGITHPNNFIGGNSPATLYVTPNGDVWVAVMKSNTGLQIQHSSNGGATWMNAPVTLDVSAMLGVTTWIDFENLGKSFVGVFAGENGEVGATSQFLFFYIDQNFDPSVLANWTNDSASIPTSFGIEKSDDHVSAARDPNDNQYFAVKTEGGSPTDPLIKLYKRTPDGNWSQFRVTETQDVPEASRPSIVIDEDASLLSIYTNGAEIVSPTQRQGRRVTVSLNSLQDIATTPFSAIFSEPNTIFTDLITPRHAVNSVSGVVVLAHNRTDETIWFSADEDQSGALVPNVVGLSQAAAQQAIVSARLVVGAVTRVNSSTIPAGTVISQSPGESIRDNFSNTSFGNNNGSLNWAGNWIEVDGAGSGPIQGNARIQFGELSLDDRPNTGGQPSLARQANLSNFGVASLSFNFRTTRRVDRSDSIVVEISNNGGQSWTELENFTGFSGSFSASRRFDISVFTSAETRIRYRVNNLYGGFNEKFLVDHVEISLAGFSAPEGSPVNLTVSSGPPSQGDDDDDDDDDD